MLCELNRFYKGKRILLTGHTGFKGSWFSLWLHKFGADVIGYALEPPTTPNLFEICNLNNKIVSIMGDVRDQDMLKNVFNKYQPEIVFHMAAQSLVRNSYKQPVETYEVNVMGTINLFEACRQSSSVRVIVNVTSDKCYENYKREKFYKEIDPIGGHDPYSSSKGCSELVTQAYSKSFFNSENCSRDYNVFLASARSGNVIGGGDWAKDRLVPDCINAFIGNEPVVIRYPDAVRPWQHVLEPLYGYLLLAERLHQNGPEFIGPWNFGPHNDSAKSVKWLLEQLTKMWGNNASWALNQNREPHEAQYLKLDSSKAKAKLSWCPQWDLQTALRKTVECYGAYYNNKDVLKIILKQIGDYENDTRKTKVKCNEL